MPPRGGRGRGRGASRGSRGATARAHRTGRIASTIKNQVINGHSHDRNGVHALFDRPGLLIVAGLRPEHFSDYLLDDEVHDDHDSSESHSDYGSATAKTPRKSRAAPPTTAIARVPATDITDEDMHGAEHTSNPGTDGDWTETDVEVFVAPKTRGFYRPPPRREVVRRRVRKSESSRYNSAIPKVRRTSAAEDSAAAIEDTTTPAPAHAPAAEDESTQPPPSVQLSQKSSRANDEVPIIVEQQPTDDEREKVDRSASTPQSGRGRGRGRGRGGRGRGRKVTTPPPEPRPEIIDEGELSDSNFPRPFGRRIKNLSMRQCEDKADFIMKKKFRPMTDPQAFVKSLTKIDPRARSTEVLYAIALNAQKALKAWQDEYLALDRITAPRMNPPKKPQRGGRDTIDPLIYDDMLEADLYGYNYDPKKAPGMQDPFRQRPGGGKFVGGRELRQRRGRDVGAVDLSEQEIEAGEGYGTRRRRAAQRQQNNPSSAPAAALATSSTHLEVPSRRGVKRTVSDGPASEYSGRPRKRGRPSAAEKNALQTRVQQLREESGGRSPSSEQDGQSPEPLKRRGRPPGIKNAAPRSDAGIKKGPRKSRLGAAQEDSEEISIIGESETPVSQRESIVDDDPEAVAVNGTALRGKGKGKAINGDTPTPTADPTNDVTDPSIDSKDPKKRVRSEKRSKSMTEWWAARKAKAAEDRKQALAQQAEADRLAEEQARAAHAAHQAQFPHQDARYWPQIAPQHVGYHPSGPGPSPLGGHVTFGPQPSMDRMRPGGPPTVFGPPPPGQPAVSMPPPSPQHARKPSGLPGLPPSGSRPEHVHAALPPPAAELPQAHPSAHPQNHSQPHPQSSQPLAGPPQQAQSPRQLPPPPIPPQPHSQGPPPHTIHQGTPPRLPPSTLSMALGPPPLLQHAPPHHRPPSVSFASSPPQPRHHHVFHHHPAPPPAPPGALQFSPPQSYAGAGQASPLRRIINYVSDPSKAAPPAGPPYQTIMTPGTATSPTIIQHHGHQVGRPPSRGRTPPPTTSAQQTPAIPPPPQPPSQPAPGTAGGFMSAFPINNTAGRPPIPGTGSFRPDTPGKSTFTHYTVYTPPTLPRAQGRMTGAQVQDLALAAVQPVQRKPIEEVLREQREWSSRPPAGSMSAADKVKEIIRPFGIGPGAIGSGTGLAKLHPTPTPDREKERPASRESPFAVPHKFGVGLPSPFSFATPKQYLPPLGGLPRPGSAAGSPPGPGPLGRLPSRERSASASGAGLAAMKIGAAVNGVEKETEKGST